MGFYGILWEITSKSWNKNIFFVIMLQFFYKITIQNEINIT